MIAGMKFTEARNKLTNVIDRVQSFTPVVIQPRKESEEYTFLLKQALVIQLLTAYKFDLKLADEEEGSYAFWLEPFDLYGYGETREEALNSLVEDVLTYVEDYLANPVRYFNAPNRRHHLPFVLKVTMCNNAEEVKHMLLSDAS